MIKYNQMKINGAFLLHPDIAEDSRGEFVETWHRADYNAIISVDWKTDAIAKSYRGVLKGLHGDWKTWKLVCIISGRTFFTMVDCRSLEDTYGRVLSFILSSRNYNQVLIPPGVAIGQQCLSESCILQYKQSEFYSPETQFTIDHADSLLNISWPIKDAIISQRDQKGSRFVDIGKS